MRYTQGEWSFDPNESEFSDKHYIFCPAGKTICSIFGPHDDPEDEANGNALLMAAAPDLLSALLLALDRLYAAERERRYDHETFDSNAHDLAIKKAIAAIAKATGEQK